MRTAMDTDILHDEARTAADAEKQQRLECAQLLEDLRTTFGTPAGGRVLEWILDACRVNGSVYTGNARTHYLSGRQDFGNRLLDLVLRADLDIYIRLLRSRADQLAPCNAAE